MPPLRHLCGGPYHSRTVTRTAAPGASSIVVLAKATFSKPAARLCTTSRCQSILVWAVGMLGVEGVIRDERATGRPREPYRPGLFALVTVARQASCIDP